MINSNPFHNYLNEATRILTNDFDIHFTYGKLPAGAGAAYDHKSNTIMLPPINTALLSEKEKMKFRALVYHETRHFFFTNFEVYNKMQENKVSKLLYLLTNNLEDRRIEKIKYKIWFGGKEALNDHRINMGNEIIANENIEEKNLLGYLTSYICNEPYVKYPMNDNTKKYWNAAKEIIKFIKNFHPI